MLLKAYVKASVALDAAKARLAGLGKDESGASLVEYSLLIGLISVAVVATVGLVGDWIVGAWEDLNGALAG